MPPFMANNVVSQHVAPAPHHPCAKAKRQYRASFRSQAQYAFVVFRGKRFDAGHMKIGIVYGRSWCAMSLVILSRSFDESPAQFRRRRVRKQEPELRPIGSEETN